MPLKLNRQIDNLNEKILHILYLDARTSLSDIANECGVSSSAILKRIKKMKKSGVILGTELRLKRGTLGYPYQASVGIRAETPSIDLVAEAVRKQPNVIVCCKGIGKYNMFCLAIARNTDELDSAMQKIKNIKGVKEIAIDIWVEEPYLKFHANDIENAQNQNIDSIDVQIIQELQKDARKSFVEIGKTLKLSHETVRKRYEKLKEIGIIRYCSVVIDWSKLGYQGTLFIFISLGQGNERSKVCEQMIKIPEVHTVTKVMGAYDIQAHARVKDLRDYAKLADEIQRIPGVQSAVICFATFTYFSYSPQPRTSIKCDTLELS